MSLFTPGPWKVERVGGNLFTQVKPVYQPTAWTPPICTLHEPDTGEIAPEVERANARLIAAAPDLLEALRELVAVADAHDVAAWNWESDDAMSKARAAIAKAVRS